MFSDREIYQISLAKLITQFPVDITFDDLISTLYCQNHIMAEHHDRADNCFHRTVSLVDYDILRTDCNRAAAIPDKVHLPDEGCHMKGCRAVVDFSRCSYLIKLSFVHNHDPVGQCHRLLLVMGYENNRDTEVALDLFQLLTHLLADLRIQCGKWLVQQ